MIKFLLFIVLFYFLVKFVSRMFLPVSGSQRTSRSPFEQFSQFYQQQQQYQQGNSNRYEDQFDRSGNSTGRGQERFSGIEEADFEIIDEEQEQQQKS